MKLFTKGDLERAARLSLTLGLVEADPEAAISRAVATVANETDDYFSREQVLEVAKRAALGDHLLALAAFEEVCGK